MAVFAVMGTLVLTTLAASAPRAFAQTNNEGSPQAQAILRHTPRGSVTLQWQERTENLTVTIRLFGLAANSTHPAHIHLGDCDDNGVVLWTRRIHEDVDRVEHQRLQTSVTELQSLERRRQIEEEVVVVGPVMRQRGQSQRFLA